MSESDKILGRRTLLRRALVVIAASPVLGAALTSCGGGPSCTTDGLGPPQLAIRSGRHSVQVAADPARRCAGCQLFTGTPDACGTCSSVPGSIDPNGSCDAFIARA